ncbi:MAG TPA: hypothetical protein VLA91_17025 [Acidimicrobiia bacterium]|nr:hypothetical protein [Acidimicrobiia bacterium]
MRRIAAEERFARASAVVFFFALVLLSAWGTTVAALKGHRVSAFFGGAFTLFLLALTGTLFSDDQYGDVVGYGLPVLLLLFGWVPIVGAARLARPDSWWWRRRYSNNRQFEAVMKYQPLR